MFINYKDLFYNICNLNTMYSNYNLFIIITDGEDHISLPDTIAELCLDYNNTIIGDKLNGGIFNLEKGKRSEVHSIVALLSRTSYNKRIYFYKFSNLEYFIVSYGSEISNSLLNDIYQKLLNFNVNLFLASNEYTVTEFYLDGCCGPEYTERFSEDYQNIRGIKIKLDNINKEIVNDNDSLEHIKNHIESLLIEKEELLQQLPSEIRLEYELTGEIIDE